MVCIHACSILFAQLDAQTAFGCLDDVFAELFLQNLEGALASAVARVSELDAFVLHAASKGAHFFIGGVVEVKPADERANGLVGHESARFGHNDIGSAVRTAAEYSEAFVELYDNTLLVGEVVGAQRRRVGVFGHGSFGDGFFGHEAFSCGAFVRGLIGCGAFGRGLFGRALFGREHSRLRALFGEVRRGVGQRPYVRRDFGGAAYVFDAMSVAREQAARNADIA